ncbi:MAG TPA: AMP-binding protein [Solirubrobacteraceae bacterium]|nr:AMP-binding protein [Solirubrobacteraceae bacterium]
MSGISSWARYWSRFSPRRPALVHEERIVTWQELETACSHLAGGLHALGIDRGDRVGALLRNGPVHFEVVLACARVGAIFVPLNPMLTPVELREQSEDAELTALVTDSSFVAALSHLEQVVGAERILFADAPPAGGRALDELRGADPIDDDSSVDMSDPLFLCYTSGTTGSSKGAVLTHGNCEGLAVSVMAADDLGPDDRALVTVPLAFTGAGVSFAMPILHCGGSMLIREAFEPEAVLDDIERRGVTFIGVVPVVLERLANAASFEERNLSGLRVAKAGGASVPESLLRLYQQRGVPLVGAYGLTEGTGCNLELPAHDALRKLGSTGLPLLGQRAMVVTPDGSEAGPGEPGELLLGGACVMQGYWKQPEITAQTIRDGWLHTGDVATMDEDGYYRIVDRQKDMIISGGINVYPAEVERALSGHPDVVELAVVGVPDDRWGEAAVVCAVSSNPHLTLDDLLSVAADTLAPFKRPRRLELMDQPLPRGMSGKVLKRELRRTVIGSRPADAAS